MRALMMTAAAAALLAACGAPSGNDGESEAEFLARAAEIHDRILTLDTHVDTGPGFGTPALDPGGPTDAQVDLPKMREGGLDAAFFIVYVGQGALSAEGYAEAHAEAENKYEGIRLMLENHPDQISLAVTADEVEQIAATGRRVALIGMENAFPLGPSIADIPMWAERGVRYMSITHFGNNQFGTSSNPNLTVGDDPVDRGLTDLGRALVAELNDYGIMIDVSHVGKETGLEAIRMSRAPVMGSHSGVQGVYAHPRNFDDEQLRANRDNGGIAQMVAFRGYVQAMDEGLAEARNALMVEMGLDTPEGRANASAETFTEARARMAVLQSQYPDVTLSDFVDHIDHAVAVAGIDHVGIASDFDGGGGVGGWDDATTTPAVTAELLRRGYSEEDIAKIWGLSVLRVMRAVEAAAIH
ncbi:MAG: membrane dipeptidase [Maricaulis sp.]|uniref:dipeptidase n=1 Tax=Maricaulis sp. TaxID=1486257 RepID=UPI001B2D3128|nr:membrane dipeptidase [Maricaulis sp.]MBO6729359.1 membrane dipeptidase [Maricaulis sp.]MBO6846877.1 membrane dipeptidase [Maricaulis sp.]MBO6876235.1 membrane dipeptidase [Maricaulis sp.]